MFFYLVKAFLGWCRSRIPNVTRSLGKLTRIEPFHSLQMSRVSVVAQRRLG